MTGHEFRVGSGVRHRSGLYGQVTEVLNDDVVVSWQDGDMSQEPASTLQASPETDVPSLKRERWVRAARRWRAARADHEHRQRKTVMANVPTEAVLGSGSQQGPRGCDRSCTRLRRS